MSAKKLTACPKCGGDSGFEFYVRTHMEGSWGEDDSESTGKSGDYTKTVACLDCGHRVRRKRAEGWGDD